MTLICSVGLLISYDSFCIFIGKGISDDDTILTHRQLLASCSQLFSTHKADHLQAQGDPRIEV